MTQIDIADFRIFKDKKIKLGSMVTVIAGTNGTGKSNLLGIIGNCVELKTGLKRESYYKPKIFRTEFNEIFKGSQTFDKTKSKRITINFDDGDQRVCRTTWQNHKTRFRVIPETVPARGQKKQSIKKEIPVIYLGLSRLYPIGEAKSTSCKSIVNLSSEATQWIKEQAIYILNMTSDDDIILDVSRIDIESLDRKIGIGFKTVNYDPLSNSAGQDNIGQILSAIWRFKELKDSRGNTFPGGILLIDELDATLHPSSQIKLFDLLVRQARILNIQIIFTTHSMSIIEDAAKKTIYNNNEQINNIELVYITTATGYLEILTNPSIEQIRNELYAIIEPIAPKIKIYTEDSEARWFLNNLLKHLLNDYDSFVRIIDNMNIGCNSLISLYQADSTLFNDVINILDGDSNKDIPKSHNGENRDMHFLTLPGEKSPEAVLIDYLCDSNDLECFYRQQKLRESGFNVVTMKSIRADIEQYSDEKKKRDRRKAWFANVRSCIDQGDLFSFWAKSNKDLCEEFKEQFIESYNFIADNLRIKRIS